MSVESRLFDPLKVGNMLLANRIIMAPLTRFRADDDHVPTQLQETYYDQRSRVSGTLIVTEATNIAPKAVGYPYSPGIWSSAQIENWRKITRVVHKNGSYIFLQLWATGRTAVPAFLATKGYDVVSSSANQMPGSLRFGASELTPAVPRALREEEIWDFISLYAQAAKNAIQAGFDGVEIHGASGYLIDQFTQTTANYRTDHWGGSVENRSRFGFEVAKAVVDAVGANRTGFRVGPFNKFQGMGMEDPVPQFTDLLSRLSSLNLAYLHIVGPSGIEHPEIAPTLGVEYLLQAWTNGSPVFLNSGFGPGSAKKAVDQEFPDRDVAIVFGRLFISNPDLVYRIRENIPLSDYDRTTFYAPKISKGYIDYSFSNEYLAKQNSEKEYKESE